MWYGSHSVTHLAGLYHNKHKRSLKLHKRRNQSLAGRGSFFTKRIHFYVPQAWTCTILAARTFTGPSVACLLAPIYYFHLPLRFYRGTLAYSRGGNTLTVTLKTVPHMVQLLWRALTHLFSSFLKPTLIKLKFKGKGYYVFKGRRSTITPQFGFAHRRYFYTSSFRVRFLSKTKIILFGYTRQDLHDVAYAFKNYKPMNVFTGRGVRFARQVVYRKTGKVSLYR